MKTKFTPTYFSNKMINTPITVAEPAEEVAEAIVAEPQYKPKLGYQQ